MRYNRESKFLLRVWFNGKTFAFQAKDTGSIPVTRFLVGVLVGVLLKNPKTLSRFTQYLTTPNYFRLTHSLLISNMEK